MSVNVNINIIMKKSIIYSAINQKNINFATAENQYALPVLR